VPVKLERRLRKLEALSHDGTGLVPHSEEWYAYHVSINSTASWRAIPLQYIPRCPSSMR
jgi:hypothetical protein